MYAFEFKTKCSSCGNVAITQNQNWKCQFCNKLNRLNFKKLDETKLALDDGKSIENEPQSTDQPLTIPSTELPYWMDPNTLTFISIMAISFILLFSLALIPPSIEAITTLIITVAIIIIAGLLYNWKLTRSIRRWERIIRDHYKSYVAVFIILLLLISVIPVGSGKISITMETKQASRSEADISDEVILNSFDYGNSRNIVRGIDNKFYLFLYNTTDIWCTVITKDGPVLTPGTSIQLVGASGIIQVTGDPILDLSVDINRSRTEIFITWIIQSIGTEIYFSKCVDLDNIELSASWRKTSSAR